MLELYEILSTPSLLYLPGEPRLEVVAPHIEYPFVLWNILLCMGQIELKCVITLNWRVWNRTVSILKLFIYAKLNCLK